MAAALMLVVLPGSALAAPANDLRANAIQLNVPDFVAGTNIDATTSATELLTPGDPDGFGCRADGTEGPGGTQMHKTVWWRFIGTGEDLTVSTGLSDFDTVVSVWTEPVANSLLNQGCNDDIDGPDGRLGSEVVIPTVNGTTYFIQVGGCFACPLQGGGTTDDEGTINLSLASPPGNDERGAARSVAIDEIVDDFTFGALTGPDDPSLACDANDGTVPYGKTVWFSFASPGEGDVTITAGGFDTVVSLYRADNLERLACNFNPAGGTATLTRRVGAGNFLVQVGGIGAGVAAGDGGLNFRVSFARDTDGDNDGFSPPQDCNDGNAGIRPGVAEILENGVDENCDGVDGVNLDRDGDRINRPADCNDANAAIRPGAREIPGNDVDENCDDDKADFTSLRVSYDNSGGWRGGRYKFRTLRFANIPAGTTARIVCRGPGCRKTVFTRRFARKTKSFDFARTGAVRRLRLRPKVVFEVQLTRTETIGQVVRFTTRRLKAPRRQRLCLRPGARRAASCI